LCVGEPGRAQSGTSGVTVVCEGSACPCAHAPDIHRIEARSDVEQASLAANRRAKILMPNKLADKYEEFPAISFTFDLIQRGHDSHPLHDHLNDRLPVDLHANKTGKSAELVGIKRFELRLALHYIHSVVSFRFPSTLE
jgi:hypothetical protein